MTDNQTAYEIAVLKMLVTMMLTKDFAGKGLDRFDEFCDDINRQILDFPTTTKAQEGYKAGIRAEMAEIFETVRQKLP